MNKISIGWVWLEQTLNGIIDQVNQQKPLQSASIAVDESPNGTLLKVVGKSPPDQTSGGGGGQSPQGGQWIPVDVMDSHCNRSTIYVWASPTKPNT